MSGELSLEEMGSKLGSFESKLDGFIASYGKKANEDDKTKEKEKEAAIKKANDEKEKEHKEAKRAALEAAIKKAMEEPIDEKKEAAIKKAMSDYGHEDDKTKKEAMSEDDKENKEHVAAIISDKKIDIDNKILQAAAMSNPTGHAALKLELQNGSFTASKKMYETMEKMFGTQIFKANTNVPTPAVTAPPPFFMAGAVAPATMDANQLNASSSVMEFSKLSTKDLLEGKI